MARWSALSTASTRFQPGIEAARSKSTGDQLDVKGEQRQQMEKVTMSPGVIAPASTRIAPTASSTRLPPNEARRSGCGRSHRTLDGDIAVAQFFDAALSRSVSMSSRPSDPIVKAPSKISAPPVTMPELGVDALHAG